MQHERNGCAACRNPATPDGVRPVDDFQQVEAGLFFWQGFDPSVKADLSSCALALKDLLIFIDPIPLAKKPMRRLMKEAAPAAIIVTNGNHKRASSEFNRELGVPIFAHAESRGDLDAGRWIEDGDLLFDSLTVIHLPGAGAGEIALHTTQNGGLMAIGDALINLDPYGFSVLPDKYCADPKLARKSLRKLLQFQFELMTFAHGFPLRPKAREKLEQLL